MSAMQIGEVARRVGVATSAIRFYEDEGLLPEPERTPSGYRDYHPSVIDRLGFIRAGQAVGLTLRELHDVLQIRDGGEAPCRHVSDLIEMRIDQIDQQIRHLEQMRRDLVAVAESAADFDPALCTPESVCKILAHS